MRDGFSLDSSALLHVALQQPGFTNLFRLEAVLAREVDPVRLQSAVEAVAMRFPSLAAGVHCGMLEARAMPAVPQVERDTALLAPMSSSQLKQCALRVLYSGQRVAIECFHGLADGCGGLHFFKALLTDYLERMEDTGVLGPPAPPDARGWRDDYYTYAGPGRGARPAGLSYLPAFRGGKIPDIRVTKLCFELEQALQTARRLGGTLTELFVALLESSIQELQAEETAPDTRKLPVQVLVPADLRRIFPSRTMQNFTMFALPDLKPEEALLPPQAVVRQVRERLHRDFAPETLRRAISANVRLARNPLVRPLPLAWKCAGVRAGFACFGAKNSALTLSNLGTMELPLPLRQHLREASFQLTPRLNSPYNCGMLSLNGQLVLSVTRRCAQPALEQILVRRCAELGLCPQVKTDAAARGEEWDAAVPGYA